MSVHNPALWAAKLFSEALKARGITIDGQTLVRNSRVPQDQRFNPAQSIELASINSQPLSEIVKRTNKESVNVNAELILRTLGRERGEMAALPEAVGKERGDDEAGLGVMRVWLARADVPTPAPARFRRIPGSRRAPAADWRRAIGRGSGQGSPG